MQGGQRERLNLGEFLERDLRPRLAAETVYGSVDFKTKRGRYWRGPCPLHGGDNPAAFAVDTVTLGWTCFTRCGTGSALSFVSGGESPRGQAFVDAVRKLADLAGVEMPRREQTPEEVQHAQERERRGNLLEAFLHMARVALESDTGEAARRYLARRGFEDLEAQDFGLYTNPQDVTQRLEEAGFTASEVEASGLLADARWAGRLVGPWRNRWGRLETFWARDLSGKVEDGEKYLYLRGTTKADLVAFGLDVALRDRRRELVLVEGLLDVLSLRARGFPNVAAIGGSGKEFTPARWEALTALGVREVTLALDNDTAGQDGTLAALDNAHKGRNVPVTYVVDPSSLGDSKDPDELVRKDGGPEAFRLLLEERQPGALFRGLVLLEGIAPASPTAARRDAVERVLDLAAGLRGPRADLDREDLLHLTEERTGYTKETLAEQWKARAERRREEDLKRDLGASLRTCQDELAGTKAAPLEVARRLTAELAAIRMHAVDEPPPFDVERLDRESRAIPAGKRSGWEKLDALEVRFNAGELALLGARTGHGKTSALVGLFLNMLEDPTGDQDELLVFYSLEEPEVRVYHRLLSLLTAKTGEGWSVNEVRDYLLNPERGTWPSPPRALDEARERLRVLQDRLLVVCRPSWDVDALAAHASAETQRRRVGAVLVDYLQRIPAPAGLERRDIEVSTVARRLKTLAVDLAAPVVAGAQINRAAVADVAKGAGKIPSGEPYESPKVQKALKARRPKLHHLREGGSEQEADLVLGLLNYRADYETDEDEDGERTGAPPEVTLLEVGTLKNRYGEPGRWARLAFEGRFQRIRDPRDNEEV